MWTGRGTYRHYVEFDVSAPELERVGGLYGVMGLGRYQQFVSSSVLLQGRNPVFGQLGTNYGQYIFVGGLGAGAAGTGYWIISR